MGTELAELHDGARPLTIDGVLWKLAPLRVGDIVELQTAAKDARYAEVLERLRRTPVAESTIPDTLAKVASESVAVMDVLNDFGCRQSLCRTSVTRGGGNPAALDALTPGKFSQIWLAVLYVSDLGETEDPFDDASTDTC